MVLNFWANLRLAVLIEVVLIKKKRVNLDTFRSDTANIIESTKEKYLMSQGVKLADQSTGQKTYWKIMNEFLNKTKIPRIPPLFLNGKQLFCRAMHSI